MKARHGPEYEVLEVRALLSASTFAHATSAMRLAIAPAAASLTNLAIFAGGRGGGPSVSGAVQIFDPSTDQFTDGPSLSTPRSDAGAASASDIALFAGGSSSDPASSIAVDIYSAASGRWSRTTLPHNRSGAGLAS